MRHLGCRKRSRRWRTVENASRNGPQPAQTEANDFRQRHLRTAAFAIAKNNWHFPDTQGFAPTDYRFKDDFESNRRFGEAEQGLAANGEKAAHGVVHAGQGISYARGKTRNSAAPDWPARCSTACNI